MIATDQSYQLSFSLNSQSVPLYELKRYTNVFHRLYFQGQIQVTEPNTLDIQLGNILFYKTLHLIEGCTAKVT